MRDQEVQQEALAAARRPEHERVADVLDVQVEGIRRLVGVSNDGERLPPQMRTDRLAVVEREQEAQVRDVGLEQRQPPQVVRAVAGDDG